MTVKSRNAKRETGESTTKGGFHPQLGTFPANLSLLGQLNALVAGIRVHTFDLTLFLNRPKRLPLLATKTVRGLAGYALRDLCEQHAAKANLSRLEAAQIARDWFKPGERGHLPPPFLIQPQPGVVFDTRADVIPVRFVSWDARGDLAEVVREAFETEAPGRRFGSNQKLGRNGRPNCRQPHIAGIETSPIARLQFELATSTLAHSTLHLLTPLSLKAQLPARARQTRGGLARKRTLRAEEITLSHIVRAAVSRLNHLSTTYGAGTQLNPAEFLHQVSLSPILRFGLYDHRSRGRSEDQNTARYVQGVLGTFEFGPLSPSLDALFQAIRIFHAGHGTSQGCGLLELREIASQDSNLSNHH